MYVLKIPMTENGKESFSDAFDTAKNKFAAESFVHEQVQNLCKYYENFMETLEMKLPVPVAGGGQTEVILSLKDARLGELEISTDSNWIPTKFKDNNIPVNYFELKISSKIESLLIGFSKIYTRRIERHNESVDLMLDEQFKILPTETKEQAEKRIKTRESEEKRHKLSLPSCVEEAVYLTMVDALKAKREEGSTKSMQNDFKEFYSEEKKEEPTKK